MGYRELRILGKTCLLASLALVLNLGQARAGTLSGTYFIGDGSDGNQATGTGSGPFHLSSTNSTFSYVAFIPNQTVTFAQLTALFADFVSNSGGSGGGSPRLSVGLEVSPTDEENLHIYFGNSPNYTDSDTVLNTWSGVNLIGNNDAGRYDTSNFAGGSPFTDYDSALALVGGLTVEEIDFVTDTFGDFPSRDLTLNSIGGSFQDATSPAPEPATATLALLGMASFAGYRIRRRKLAA